MSIIIYNLCNLSNIFPAWADPTRDPKAPAAVWGVSEMYNYFFFLLSFPPLFLSFSCYFFLAFAPLFFLRRAQSLNIPYIVYMTVYI